MNGATFLMLMQSMRLATSPIKQNAPYTEEIPEEKPKVIPKSQIRYIHDDPLQIEVHELLKQKYQ